MRGSQGRCVLVEPVRGIIPAHAGLTSLSVSVRSCVGDHPRACGAHQVVLLVNRIAQGSSPRMRGSLCIELFCFAERGIIPAHAGLTYRIYRTKNLQRDHPRACGAHVTVPLSFSMPKGSSPRMRGSHTLIPITTNPYGIIPAHAGLTGRRSTSSRSMGDHPRACGAHCEMKLTEKQRRGSSPRMRGSHSPRRDVRRGLGIIPAHAGLTFCHAGANTGRRDHPRACGAHSPGRKAIRASAGSSPRMRGSRLLLLHCKLNLGIIPAHAGLT